MSTTTPLPLADVPAFRSGSHHRIAISFVAGTLNSAAAFSIAAASSRL